MLYSNLYRQYNLLEKGRLVKQCLRHVKYFKEDRKKNNEAFFLLRHEHLYLYYMYVYHV